MWDKLIQGFVIALIWLYEALGSTEWSLVLSITILTIAVRLITIPFTVPSQQAMKKNSAKMAAKVAGAEPWSFEDAVLDDMTEERIRRVPRNCEHSVAWIIWHIARCEDITMNLLVGLKERTRGLLTS